MERPHLPARRGPLAALALALLLIASVTGCDTGPVGPAPAATVDGREISFDEVRAQVDAVVSFTQTYGEVQGREQAEIDSALAAYVGVGEETLATEGFASALSSLVEREVYREALRLSGGKVTDAMRKEVRTEIEQQLTDSGLKPEQVPDAVVDLYVDVESMGRAIAAEAEVAEPTEAELRAAYDERVGDYSRICFEVIAGPDEATVQAALDRVDGGEDFHDVALEVSPDSATPEDQQDQCLAPTDLGQVFPGVSDAAAGDRLGPVETQGTWVAIEVSAVEVPTFEDVRDQLAADLSGTAQDQQGAFVQEQLAKARERLDVQVNPRFGTWDAATGQVVAPTAPEAPYVTSVTAIGTASGS